MLEKQLQTQCAKEAIRLHPELKDVLDKLDREGALKNKPAKPASKASKAADVGFEYWVNNLLANPMTQVKNVLSNFVPIVTRPLETVGAAGLGNIRRGLGGEGDIVTFREALAEANGIAQGSLDALRFFSIMTKSKFSKTNEQVLKELSIPEKLSIQAKVERPKQVITGENIDNEILRRTVDFIGAGINIPGRLLNATDTLFKIVHYRAEVSKQAMRQAMNEGTTDSKQISASYHHYKQQAEMGASPDLVEKGIADADIRTYTNKPEGKLNQLMAAEGHDAGLRWIVPFRRTMVNVINYGVDRSPAAMLKGKTWQALAGDDPIAREEAISRMATGTAIFSAMAYLVGDKLDGRAPLNPQAKELWLQDGHKQYTMRIGDRKIPLESFGGFSVFLKAFADTKVLLSNIDDSGDDNTESLKQDISMHFLLSVADAMREEHWLPNISEFLNMVERASGELKNQREKGPGHGDPMDPIERFAGKMASSFVYRPVEWAAKGTDPYKRDKAGPFGALQAKIPIWSQQLAPKIDLWGNVTRHDNFIDPAIASRVTGKDEVARELFRLPLHIPVAERSPSGVKMTAMEYAQYMQASGRGVFGAPPLRDALIQAMTSDIYRKFNTDKGRAEYIKSIILQYRKGAREHMLMTTDWGRRVMKKQQKEAFQKGVSQ